MLLRWVVEACGSGIIYIKSFVFQPLQYNSAPRQATAVRSRVQRPGAPHRCLQSHSPLCLRLPSICLGSPSCSSVSAFQSTPTRDGARPFSGSPRSRLPALSSASSFLSSFPAPSSLSSCRSAGDRAAAACSGRRGRARRCSGCRRPGRFPLHRRGGTGWPDAATRASSSDLRRRGGSSSGRAAGRHTRCAALCESVCPTLWMTRRHGKSALRLKFSSTFAAGADLGVIIDQLAQHCSSASSTNEQGELDMDSCGKGIK